MMNPYAGIAVRIGASSASVETLIEKGESSPDIAAAIGTTMDSVTNFIDGHASAGIAAALGTSTENAQLLRDALAREGAIGLLLGLACAR
jgi:hypothetical protein